MSKIFDNAINKTLITSGIILIVEVALQDPGGETLRGFSFALFIGIGIGNVFVSIYCSTYCVRSGSKSFKRGSFSGDG